MKAFKIVITKIWFKTAKANKVRICTTHRNFSSLLFLGYTTIAPNEAEITNQPTTESESEPESTTVSVETTTQSNNETTNEPVETTTDSSDTTTQPSEGTTHPSDNGTTDQPSETTNQPSETTNQPAATTTNQLPETTTNQVLETTTNQLPETTTNPAPETTQQPETTTNQPAETITNQPPETTSQPETTESNQETTTQPNETTEANREESTTQAGQETTTEAIGEATTNVENLITNRPSNGNSSCPPLTEEGQAHYVCPTGFRRHPQDCGMFYQCTQSPETSHLSIVSFECPNGTVYDEDKIQCRDRNNNDNCPSKSTDRSLLRGTIFDTEHEESPTVSYLVRF